MVARNVQWERPPANMFLSHDDVHVWRASLDQPVLRVQWLARTLDADERLRAQRFYFEQDRIHFTVARGLLRTILGYYLGIEPGRLRFSYGAQGKPSLEEMPEGERIRFNLARSRGLSLYAFTLDREIGVDLEHIRLITETEQSAHGFFSDQEKAAFQGLVEHQKQRAFFRYWTCKEAYLKASGEGLELPLDQIDVLLASGKPARLLSINGDIQEASRWSLEELKLVSGFAAALVVERDSYHLSCWQWSENLSFK